MIDLLTILAYIYIYIYILHDGVNDSGFNALRIHHLSNEENKAKIKRDHKKY